MFLDQEMEDDEDNEGEAVEEDKNNKKKKEDLVMEIDSEKIEEVK